MDNALEFLTSLIHRGGPVMWPIVLCALAVLIVTVRKALQWASFALQVFLTRARWAKTLATFPAEPAEQQKVLRDTGSPMAKPALRALATTTLPLPEALANEGGALARKLATGLGLLDSIVTLAPMLGILGTVTGIITSFDLMGSSGVDDPTGVASGIAEALITTAAGLVTSIVALLPLNAGRTLHRALCRAIESALSQVEHALTQKPAEMPKAEAPKAEEPAK